MFRYTTGISIQCNLCNRSGPILRYNPALQYDENHTRDLCAQSKRLSIREKFISLDEETQLNTGFHMCPVCVAELGPKIAGVIRKQKGTKGKGKPKK
jgi:hypothetical protein